MMIQYTFKVQDWTYQVRAHNLEKAVQAFFKTHRQIDTALFEIEDGPEGIAYRNPGRGFYRVKTITKTGGLESLKVQKYSWRKL